MKKTTANRFIHAAGLLCCAAAIAIVGEAESWKAGVALGMAVVGLIGNGYGIYRPTTLLR